jgi:hypothetical protein
VDTTEALVTSAQAGVNLEELVKPTGEKRVDAEFEKIMAQ